MHTVNGIGTRLYGSSDRQGNGSYVATKWLVFLYFPIFPLGTYRVYPEYKIEKEVKKMPKNVVMQMNERRVEDIKYSLFGSEQTIKLQRVRLNWKQILVTYLIGSLMVGIFLLVIKILPN